MSRSVAFLEYGPPEVLRVIDAATPEPGQGEIRVSVKAAGVQPFDCLFRSGAAHQWIPASFPQRIGNEFAGVVEAVGSGVTGVRIGEEIIGWLMLGSTAEQIILPAGQWVTKPKDCPWEEAGAISASGQTASTGIDLLNLKKGETIVVHAAAGGVGSIAAQIAVARGAYVIGTASQSNHSYLGELGAEPVTYGPGLVERIKALAPNGVNAALICVAGEEALRASLEVVRDKQRILTTAFDPLSDKLGVQRMSTRRSTDRLASLVDLYVSGGLKIRIAQAFRFEEAPAAHRLVETGHARGKVVLMP